MCIYYFCVTIIFSCFDEMLPTKFRPVTRNFSGGFEHQSERTSEENCEGAKRPSGGQGLGGEKPPSQAGEILHLDPEN